jgi:hypothetical protein
VTVLLGAAPSIIGPSEVGAWMAAKGAPGAAALLDFAGERYGFRSSEGVPRWGSVAADMVFTRASAAGRWSSAGEYEMVGNNVLRYDHDPVTRAPLGVRVENSGTNFLTQSEFPNGITDTSNRGGATAVADIEGGRTGIRLDNTSINAFAYKSASLTVGQPYAFSVFVETEDGQPPVFPSATTSDPGNTFAVIMENSSVGINPQAFAVQRVGNKLWRVGGFKAAAVATSVTNVGVLQYQTNQQRRIKVTGFQLETGAIASSYIVTGASVVTRAADWLYFDLPFDPAGEGVTVLFDGITPPSFTPAAVAMTLIRAGSLDRLQLYATTGNFGPIGIYKNGTVWGPVSTWRLFVPGARRRVVMRLTPSSLAWSQNGDAVTTSALLGAIPADMTRLEVGTVTGGNHWRSTISRIAVWKGAPFTDAQMREISAI